MRLMADNQPLRIAPHIRCCAIEQQVVILDLRANRYGVLSEQLSGPLRQVITGERSNNPQDRDPIKRLLSIGLLESGAPISRNSDISSMPRRGREALIGNADGGDGPTIVGALFSVLRAKAWLSIRRLEHWSSHLAQMGGVQSDGDILPSLGMLDRFDRARRRLPIRQVCLIDSLALTLYCRSAGRAADLVVGVRLAPFLAHAWVQAGDIVLNDEPEFVRAFTPILAV